MSKQPSNCCQTHLRRINDSQIQVSEWSQFCLLSIKWFLTPELQRIIRIIRYSNSWDRIVLFVFGIRSICDFRIIFEYPNSCHRIPNSSRIFYKQDMCRKHSIKPSCRYKLVSSKQKNILTHIETLGHIKQTKWDQTRCWYRILFIDWPLPGFTKIFRAR